MRDGETRQLIIRIVPGLYPGQHSERDGGRADDQLQELEPDDFVDERRYAAGKGEEKNERGPAL